MDTFDASAKNKAKKDGERVERGRRVVREKKGRVFGYADYVVFSNNDNDAA